MQNDSLWLEKVLRGNLAKSKFQILKWKIVNTYRDFFHWISLKIGKKLEHFVIKVHSKRNSRIEIHASSRYYFENQGDTGSEHFFL